LRIGGEDPMNLTDEEIKEYEEDFEKADKDGDGKLSLEEMKDFSDT
jgi:Ca2+-binding EF-hand superfamily protein